MADFHSVMFALQDLTMTMGKVRALFDGVLQKYPDMKHYIHPKSDIVHAPLFESALVKLEQGTALTKSEAKAVSSLLV